MVGNPRAGYLPLIDSDVVALRAVRLIKNSLSLFGQVHQFVKFVGFQVLQAGDEAQWRDHQVAVVVGVQVEGYETGRAAVEDMLYRVIVPRNLGAKDTAAVAG